MEAEVLAGHHSSDLHEKPRIADQVPKVSSDVRMLYTSNLLHDPHVTSEKVYYISL